MSKASPPQPTGCREVDEHERELTELADKLQAQAVKLLETDLRIHIATGKELALASIRARKAAADLSLARAERDNDNALFDEYKRLRGGELPPRPRLRRAG